MNNLIKNTYPFQSLLSLINFYCWSRLFYCLCLGQLIKSHYSYNEFWLIIILLVSIVTLIERLIFLDNQLPLMSDDPLTFNQLLMFTIYKPQLKNCKHSTKKFRYVQKRYLVTRFKQVTQWDSLTWDQKLNLCKFISQTLIAFSGLTVACYKVHVDYEIALIQQPIPHQTYYFYSESSSQKSSQKEGTDSNHKKDGEVPDDVDVNRVALGFIQT